MSQKNFFVIILCVCNVAALDIRRKRCTNLASHNGFSLDHHIVWPAPGSGNAIDVSGRGCKDCGLHLPGTFWTLIFLRAINAERGWCARSHVCRARRRLAGGIGREETLFIGAYLRLIQYQYILTQTHIFKIFFDCCDAAMPLAVWCNIVADILNESPERAIRVQPGVIPKGVTPG